MQTFWRRAIALLPIVFFYSCVQKETPAFRADVSIKQSEPIYLPNAFSNEVLDSNFLKQKLSSSPQLREHRDNLWNFYIRRDFRSAWFHEGKPGTAANDLLLRVRAYADVFQDSSLVSGPLFSLLDSLQLDTSLLTRKPELKAEAEFGLTSLFFVYAQKEYYGKSEKSKDLEWYIPARKKNYLQLLDTLIHPHADYKAFEPVNEMYRRLQTALQQLRKIENSGGFPEVFAIPKSVKKGDTLSALRSWKQYLSLMDAYPGTERSNLFTDTLADCIQNFQRRNGLPETGLPDEATLSEMQVPVEFRIRQIMINMERLRWWPQIDSPNYLLINIPDYKLMVFENGKPAWSMKVIVGKTATSTSIFSGLINEIVFSPYWNVPQSIAVNELLPQIKKNPAYLKRKNMEVWSGGKVINPNRINWKKYTHSLPFLIREKPGPTNSLGLVKFLFPNQYHIYLHDTPAKSLFDKDRRAFSHGCIRLAEPVKLASYLLRKDTSVNQDSIRIWMSGEKETSYKLNPGIPVLIGYFTAWVDRNGALHFRKDLYGLDEQLWKEVFGDQP